MARLAGSSRLLRAINECAALAHLLDRGPITRGDLRALTGLSKPTTSEVLRRLTEAGLATVVGRTSGGPGPTAELYAANPDAAFTAAVAVHTDGTVAAAVGDLTGATRATLDARRDLVELAAAGTPRTEQVIDAVAGIITAACTDAGLTVAALDHVQLGVPGSYEAATDTIHYVDLAGWEQPGLIAGISARLDTTVGVDNDVNLAAIAERTRGAATDADSFALLWLGDGLGLAIDLGGTLLRGGHGGAGEIGYMPVGVSDPTGRHDFQDLVGGPEVIRLARTHGIRARLPQRAVSSALAGPARDDFLHVLAHRIAVGLAAVVAVLDPPLVVLAGPVGRAGGPALAAAVSAALADVTPLRTEVTSTAMDGDAVLVGTLQAGLSAVRDALLGPLTAGSTGLLTADA